MTPQQRLGLFALHTADTAAELSAWLGDHTGQLTLAARGLDIDIDTIAGELLRLRTALDATPVLGIVGTGALGRQALVHGLLRSHGTSGTQDAIVAAFPGIPTGFDLARHVLPGAGLSPRSATLTYRMAREDRSPPGHPVRIALLTELDLILIFASLHLTHRAAGTDALALAERVDLLFADAETRIQPSASPGLSPRDVATLSQSLAQTFPESPLLPVLIGAGYWDRLGAIAGHLSAGERLRLLAVLWGEDASLTVLFAALSNGLDKLAHTHETYAVLDALVQRDPANGWFRAHPSSVLASATLQRLGAGTQSPEETVAVMRRAGTAIEIDRAVLAGLMADVTLRIDEPQRLAQRGDGRGEGGSEAFDIVDFPSPSPLPLLVDGLDPSDDRTRSNLALGDAIQLFTHVKTTYLFASAIERHGVTSLLVPIDHGADHQASAVAPLGDMSWRVPLEGWIERTQGEDAASRERNKPSLFIALVATDTEQSGNMLVSADALNARLKAVFGQPDGALPPWLAEWTPSRALPTIFRVALSGGGAGYLSAPLTRSGDRAAPGGRPSEIKSPSSPPLPPLRRLDDDNLGRAASQNGDQKGAQSNHWFTQGNAQTARPNELSGSQARSADDAPFVLDRLMVQIAGVTTGQMRHRQLTQALATQRKRLRQRLQRFNPATDPLQLAEWRRQSANVASARLRQTVLSGQMGRLQAQLTPGAEEFAVVAARAFERHAQRLRPLAEAARATMGHEPSTLPTARGMDSPSGLEAIAEARDLARAVADALLTHWSQGLRRLARSDVFARRANLAGSALQTLVDELTVAADRAGLAEDLTDLLRSGNLLDSGHRQRALRAGTLAQRVVAIFIETLSARSGRADAQSGTKAQQKTPNTDGNVSNRLDWCDAIGNMVDGNSATAHVVAGPLGSDRELAELIALLSSSGSEGEP